MSKVAIVTVGVSASGKSTWAREFLEKNHNFIEINRDTIRAQVFQQKTGRPFVWREWKWKWEDEVTAIQSEMINHSATADTVDGIIISDTNLSETRNASLKKRLEGLGFTVEFREFPVTFEEACRRDAGRTNGVGYDVIAKQFEQWNKLKVQQYSASTSLAKAIIVDVDGTLAHMNGNRGPFDWDKVYLDTVDEEVVQAVTGFYNAGYKVLIVSGRDGVCREMTWEWVCKALGFMPDGFFMRNEGDMRGDDIVKSEIFWDKIATKYNVRAVFDDRPRVCRFWRSIGIKVFQMGNPYLEF